MKYLVVVLFIVVGGCSSPEEDKSGEELEIMESKAAAGIAVVPDEERPWIKMKREWQVKKVVYYRNNNLPCDFPVDHRFLEIGEDYNISEIRCKEHIYKQTCHDDHGCFSEARKR